MNKCTAAIAIAVSTSLLFAACADTSFLVTVQPTGEITRRDGQPTATPLLSPLYSNVALPKQPDSEGRGGDNAQQELMGRILADAAARTGFSRSALIIIQDLAMTWPDGSLGCPLPGVMYTQAPVAGYHILVQAGDAVLDYRATSRGSFVLCESPLRAAPAQTPSQ